MSKAIPRFTVVFLLILLPACPTPATPVPPASSPTASGTTTACRTASPIATKRRTPTANSTRVPTVRRAEALHWKAAIDDRPWTMAEKETIADGPSTMAVYCSCWFAMCGEGK
jgi:hypothetical protein